MAKELDIKEEFRKLKLEIERMKKRTEDYEELQARVGLLEDPPLAEDQSQGGLASIGIVPDHTPPSMGQLLAIDLERGKPKSSPSGSAATITLRPCDASGSELTGEADVVVNCANDGSSISLDDTGWTTSTILPFLRFPQQIGSVDGVIVGDGASAAAAINGMYAIRFSLDIIGNTDGYYSLNATIDVRDNQYIGQGWYDSAGDAAPPTNADPIYDEVKWFDNDPNIWDFVNQDQGHAWAGYISGKATGDIMQIDWGGNYGKLVIHHSAGSLLATVTGCTSRWYAHFWLIFSGPMNNNPIEVGEEAE